MNRLISVASLAVVMAAGPAIAIEPELGARLGTSAEAISQALRESGYEMTNYEADRRKIEVYACKGNRVVEVKIDPRGGEVYKVEQEYRRHGGDGRYCDGDRRPDDDRRRGKDS